jgi:nucleoside phosphorylase
MKIYTDKYGNVFKGACPNPFHLDGDTWSPVTDEKFIELGGTIEDDGQLTPKEAVIASLDTLIHQLATQVQGITIAEFKQAAKTMISSDLIDYARAKNVPEEIITEARGRVVEIMADALRMGIVWNELIDGITE